MRRLIAAMVVTAFLGVTGMVLADEGSDPSGTPAVSGTPAPAKALKAKKKKGKKMKKEEKAAASATPAAQ
jgi:hypothetical protein